MTHFTRLRVISIHDVMPHTLDDVTGFIDRYQYTWGAPIYLLVVPEQPWTLRSLKQLEQLVARGCVLAGHGWRHRADRISGWRHRLHSTLISRNVAEHLSLDDDGIAELMHDCFQWFESCDFPAPELYVPPAWALGTRHLQKLDTTGFRWIETLTGIHDSWRHEFTRLPLLGYEADTQLRRWSLSLCNTISRCAETRRVTRLALHPNDLKLLLKSTLMQDASRSRALSIPQALGYDPVLTHPMPTHPLPIDHSGRVTRTRQQIRSSRKHE